VLVVVGPNIGLSGRTTIWPTYLDLWRGSPWTGVGDAGVGAALSDGRLPAWAYHAHNSWLDLLARHGVVVLAFSAVAIVAAVMAALPDAIAGRAASLALLAVLLTASLTQPVVGWLVPTVPAVVLVLAVMFAQPRVLASTSP
jgi:O-antigen ligase